MLSPTLLCNFPCVRVCVLITGQITHVLNCAHDCECHFDAEHVAQLTTSAATTETATATATTTADANTDVPAGGSASAPSFSSTLSLPPPAITYLHIRARDTPTERISSHFQAAFEFIESALQQRGRILVHCAQACHQLHCVA